MIVRSCIALAVIAAALGHARLLARGVGQPAGPAAPAAPGPAAPGAELVLQAGHGDLVRAVAYAPDGKSIATGCADRMVRVWDAQSGAVRWVADARGGSVSSVAFSPDGK